MVRKWGKYAALVLAGALAWSGAAAAESKATQKPVTIVLDGYPLPFDAAPRIENGVTLVPFRAIGEALGIEVAWDAKTRSVRASGPDSGGHPSSVVLQVGNKNAVVNGQLVPLAGPPRNDGGRVLIPLAFFSRQFGAAVDWNNAGKMVTIVSPKREMELRAFYALSSFGEKDLIPRFNSVAFGWSRIDETGKLTVEGKDYRWPQPAGDITPESILQEADAQHAAPYLMVYAGDKQQELTKMLRDETLRDQAIEGIVQLVRDKGFRGVVLDYEGLGWKDDPVEPRRLLNEYVKQLDGALPEGVRLSLAVPPPNGAYHGYDYGTLAKIADDLIVMAYDYNPTPSPEPDAKVDEAIRGMLQAGVPKNKLLLGISVASETAQTVPTKLGLAKRYQLKGAAFWRLGLFGTDRADAIGRSVERSHD